MHRLDLQDLSIPDARLVQAGLKFLGHYDGTLGGVPGDKTTAAYEAYWRTVSTPAAGARPLGQRLAEILIQEEGVREEPRDSNTGPRVVEYQRATWLEGTGWAWCAAFICWGIQRLEEERGALGFDRPRTAGAWDFERWAREQKLRLFKPRQRIVAGDILCFTFSHIGLAISDEKDGYVRTVEGNTDHSGDREGGGVYIQNRKTSLVRSHIRLEKVA